MKQFSRQCKQLFMRKRVLYHKTEMSHPDRSTMQVVLPTAFRKQALQGCHDDLDHFVMGTDNRSLERPLLLAWNVH